ncbi:unnamed protein product [Linum tenue]|uniref:Uncharacterized protein n=2 Tax=Linum tenue TaxID=586396 RepID=A0AAV0GZ85_9ROSI|nr:unnamed protein product [Linum tenue]
MQRWRRCCGVAVLIGSKSWRLTKMVFGNFTDYPITPFSGKELWGIGSAT